MDVTINDRLTVVIPNDQLIFGERHISRNGVVEAKEDVKQIPIVRIQADDGMMPRIGGMFFSSAYLMVNHDKNQFTIAQAKSEPAPSKLIAFDTANDCVGPAEAAAASTTPGAPTDSNAGNSDSNGSSTSSSSALSSGAIAGIVIGALSGLALILGIAFLLWRRKRRATAAVDPSPEPGHYTDITNTPVEKYAYHPPELMDRHHQDFVVAHELPGEGRPQEAGTTSREGR